MPGGPGKERKMSERQKNRIMALYLIYTTAGMRISDSLRKAVENIEKERAAAYVAGVRA